MNFTSLLQIALQKAGKHEALAMSIDLSPSGLSKRINGEIGWTEKEINSLLGYMQHEILSLESYKKKLTTLKEAMKILLDEENNHG
jgi:hypothetical protein